MAVATGKSKVTSAISVAASGATTLIAAVAGKQIYVSSYLLIAAGAVVVTWQDTSATPVALSGAMSMTTGVPLAIATDAPDHLLVTAAGKGLALNLGSAVQVSGHLSYWIE